MAAHPRICLTCLVLTLCAGLQFFSPKAALPPLDNQAGLNREFVFMDLSGLWPLVEVSILDPSGNEFLGVFQIDNGSSNTWIDSTTVEKLGLRLSESGTATTAAGISPAQFVIVPRLKVGQIEVFNLKAVIRQPEVSPAAVRKGVVGLLGADVLVGKVLTLDFPGSRVAFTSHVPALVNYKTLLEEPLKIPGKLAFVACRLPDDPEGRNCNLLLDTGSPEAVLFCDEMSEFVHLKDANRRTDLLSPGEKRRLFSDVSRG